MILRDSPNICSNIFSMAFNCLVELKLMNGFDQDGKLKQINIYPKNSKGFNLGFDITPAELVTGFITEKGIFKPEELREHF